MLKGGWALKALTDSSKLRRKIGKLGSINQMVRKEGEGFGSRPTPPIALSAHIANSAHRSAFRHIPRDCGFRTIHLPWIMCGCGPKIGIPSQTVIRPIYLTLYPSTTYSDGSPFLGSNTTLVGTNFPPPASQGVFPLLIDR